VSLIGYADPCTRGGGCRHRRVAARPG